MKNFILFSFVLFANTLFAQIWIPEEATVTTLSDGSHSVALPQGFPFVGFDSSGTVVQLSGTIKVSCTCQGTGSCNPFIGSGPSGDTQGCAGTCSICEMKVSKSGLVITDNGGYINTNASTRFISSSETLPEGFEAMLELSEVSTDLDNFLDSAVGTDRGTPQISIVNGEVIPPTGYLLKAVALYGRKVTIAVPESAIGGGGDDKASCSCSQGTCTLKKTTIPLVGSVTWCEGNCTGTCTLTK